MHSVSQSLTHAQSQSLVTRQDPAPRCHCLDVRTRADHCSTLTPISKAYRRCPVSHVHCTSRHQVDVGLFINYHVCWRVTESSALPGSPEPGSQASGQCMSSRSKCLHPRSFSVFSHDSLPHTCTHGIPLQTLKASGYSSQIYKYRKWQQPVRVHSALVPTSLLDWVLNSRAD